VLFLLIDKRPAAITSISDLISCGFISTNLPSVTLSVCFVIRFRELVFFARKTGAVASSQTRRGQGFPLRCLGCVMLKKIRHGICGLTAYVDVEQD